MRHFNEFPDLPLLAFSRALGKNRPATLEGGGKGGGDAPQAPDPYKVAGATTQTNEATAQFNKDLNLNNYSNPFGAQNTVQVGTSASGAPIYQTSITASQPLQNLISASMTAAGNSTGQTQNALFGLGGINSQIGGLASQISPTAAQDANRQGQQAAYAAQTQYLDPQFKQQQASLESQLANQGLVPGSQAYDNAMTNFNNSKNQAYSNAANQSVLTGAQIGTQMLNNNLAAVGEQGNLLGQQGANYGQQASLAQLPYSQISSLAGLVPGNTGTAQSAANPANIAQAFQNQYQGELNNYNTQVGSANSTKSGLFGLGAAAMPMMSSMMSDRRLKTDIEAVGPLKDGVNLYRYRYVWDAPGTERHGVMADEVKKVDPKAVIRTPSGYDAVNYARVLGD
ncbi:tail fiber domain-containing protein [Paraburkholderia phenoliruptrix]|uniref:tail fiber domain-containing protein n=1 Tax=Paraburkholderia phenoliruptrix TaxID=252970 RepID=UPI00285DC933|nr:tail fiber domain-containing protein [Paraburkholderia phenoliruptrix]MDR6393060.1 hypothetical protein [Paraburkholderia phenoliruptrix]